MFRVTKQKIISTLVVITMMTTVFGIVRAVSPSNIISYQGRVLNSSGVPVTSASASMAFKLFDSLSSGTCLWSNSSATCATETARTVTLTSGLFSENLGDTGNSYAAISDTVFGSDASVYLEIVINGETLTPRKLITAAPYAISTSLFDGTDSTSFVRTGATENFDLTSAKFLGASPLVFEGTTTNSITTIFTFTDPTLSNKTITFPNATGTVVTTGNLSDISSLSDSQISDTLTSSIFIGSGSATNAVDLATAEIAGTLAVANGGTGATSLANLITLATDTTGNYVATVADAGNSYFTVSGSGSENGSVTLDLINDSINFDKLADSLALDSATIITGTAGETFQLSRTLTNATTENGMYLAITAQDTTSGTLAQYGLNIENSASTEGLDALIYLNNADTDDAVATGILFNSAAGTMTTAIDATDPEITTAFSVGANDINGTTGLINYDNFDVDASGNITIAGDIAVNGGDMTTSTSTFNLLTTNATTVNFASAAVILNIGDSAISKAIEIGGVTADGTDTIEIATNATSADSITIGNTNASTLLALTGGNDWSIASNGNAQFGSYIASNQATVNVFNDLTGGTTINIGGTNTNLTNTISIATEGTNADTITIGNTNASTAVGIKAGTLTLTSGATTGTTTTSAFVLSDTLLTTGTLLYGDMRGTSGTAVNFTYGSAVTQSSSAITGLALDFTNLTGANALDMTNVALTTNGQTRSGTGTETVSGITIVSSGALSQTGASGKYFWKGVNVTSPGATVNNAAGGTIMSEAAFSATLSVITGTNGTVVSNGADIIIPDSAIVTSGTVSGYSISGSGSAGVITTGPAAGTLNGLKLPTITTPGAGTENGINVGTGWDNIISGTTAGTNLISFTNFTVTTGGAITGTFATANTERLCWDASGGSDITDCSGSPGDYAEQYGTTDATVSAGDLVVTDLSRPTIQVTDDQGYKGSKSWILKSTKPNDGTVVGIVSTQPNEVIGENYTPDENPRPIAISGRVPVNVTNENGEIHIGDFITTSSTAGKGMKAKLAGRVVGIALSDFDGVSGQVVAQIANTWFAGSLLSNDGTSNIMTDNVIVAKTGTATESTPTFDSFGLELRGSAWNGNQSETISLMMKNVVTDSNNYRLSVRNTTGTEVAYITDKGAMQVAGDMVVGGKIYPSDSGHIQNSKYIYYDGSSGPGGDFMRTNASGWSTGSYDFAEMFPSTDSLSSGDVVVFSDQSISIKRSQSSKEKSIVGIISTRPGFLAGENKIGSYPVALAGRVPTNVTTENGSIDVGDALTVSNIPGAAMKATSAGQIVGYALEPFDGKTTKQIIVFVHPGYWDGGSVGITPGLTNSASNFGSGSSSELMTSLNMSGNINTNGNNILNIGRLVGFGDLWSIEMDGTIKTESLVKNVITTHDNRKVETIAVTSPEAVITMSGSAVLENGTAEIRFAKINMDYNGVISATAPIRVIATPNSPVSLYISEKDQNHFVVKSFGGSSDNVSFDWMVTAYRKGFEPKEDLESVIDQVTPLQNEQTVISQSSVVNIDATSNETTETVLTPSVSQTVMENVSVESATSVSPVIQSVDSVVEESVATPVVSLPTP